jgi:lipoteichoic acid synthase
MSCKKDNRTWFRARDNSVDNYPGIGLKGITGDQACIAGLPPEPPGNQLIEQAMTKAGEAQISGARAGQGVKNCLHHEWKSLQDGIVLAPFVGFLVVLAYKQQMALEMADIPSRAGSLTTAATFAALLVIVPWILLLPSGRWRLAGALCLDLLLTSLLYADVLYSRQFGDFASAASLPFIGQLVDVKDSVLSLVRSGDWRLWADLPVMLSLLLAWKVVAGWSGKMFPHFRPMRIQLLTALLLAFDGVVVVALCAYFDLRPAEGPRRMKDEGHAFEAKRLGPVNYHALDLYRYLVRRTGRTLWTTNADLLEAQQWFRDHSPQAALFAEGLRGAGRGKNLIILQIEALQSFVVGARIGDQEIAPNLNRLASESLRFTQFYSQVNIGMTADADLLANCSIYPLQDAVVYYEYEDNDFRCLPALARRYGYHTVAMQGMRPAFWNLANVYPRVGFENYYNLSHGFQMDEKIALGLSDESFLRQSVEFLKRTPEPYYAFLVTLSSHTPFSLKGIPHNLRLGPLEGKEVGYYLDAQHYTDAAIGHFVEALRQEGLLDRSILVIYGDHFGITRGNTGVTELLRLLDIDRMDEVTLERLKWQVPLLMRIPGVAARVVPGLGGEIDIAPTLAAILGFSTQGFYFMGRNLLGDSHGVVALPGDGSVVGDGYLWSGNRKSRRGECYDSASGTSVPDYRCSAIVAQADREVRISRLMVEENLIPKLGSPR